MISSTFKLLWTMLQQFFFVTHSETKKNQLLSLTLKWRQTPPLQQFDDVLLTNVFKKLAIIKRLYAKGP